MRRTFYVLLCLAVFVGAGCVSVNSNSKSAGSSANTSALVESNESDLFLNNLRCGEQRVRAEEYVRDKDYFVPETGYKIYHHFKQIFYSPKLKTCLLEYEQAYLKNGEMPPETGNFILENFLTGEDIVTVIYSANGYFEKQGYWNETIEEYK